MWISSFLIICWTMNLVKSVDYICEVLFWGSLFYFSTCLFMAYHTASITIAVCAFFCHCFLTVPLIFKKQVLPSGNVKPSILVNLQDCHYSGSLKIPCGFLNRWFCLSKALRILIEFALNPWTTLGSINISAIFLQSINIRHFSICVMLDFFRQGFGISACKSFLSPGLSYA